MLRVITKQIWEDKIYPDPLLPSTAVSPQTLMILKQWKRNDFLETKEKLVKKREEECREKVKWNSGEETVLVALVHAQFRFTILSNTSVQHWPSCQSLML